MSFFLRLPSWESKKIQVKSSAILDAYNFLFKPLIEMRFKFFYNLCQMLSNDMWHAPYTHLIHGNF